MKKTKNFCIRALCAIFIGVVLGCSGGESEIGNDDGAGNSDNTNEWQQPDYYLDEELGGQQFVDPNKPWIGGEIMETYYTDSYKNAQKFMAKKVTELSQEIAGQTHIPLYQEIDTALKKFNTGDNIRDNITNNYTALAPVFADIENNQLLNSYDSKQWYDYKCSYYKLAHYAYNQPLGNFKYETSLLFPANNEMANDNYSLFVQLLGYANYDYDTLTVPEAKRCINNTLNEVANNNGVDSTVLKKLMELALYNESLYGVNDLAKSANLNTTLRSQRKMTMFANYINQASNDLQTTDGEPMTTET
ncbi:MAG: hypothetical protein K2N58_08725 [Treponemataceae bacterium]|nr:hypothetical protein [Treponemataceae bacterium]